MNNIFKESYVPTLNNMGYVTQILDEYCEEFIEYLKEVKFPVADLGVGYGFTTKRILEQGATVFANDIDERHLEVLQRSCSPTEKKRLYLIPGKLPQAFNHLPNSLSGVLAARCFHFLRGEEINLLVENIYKSLVKGGMLCIVAETPYLKHLEGFIPLYEKRKSEEVEWPGYIDALQKYTNRPNSSVWVNLLDPDLLERTLRKAGFEIKKVGFIDRYYFPKEVRLGGKESAGIIGLKK